MSHSQSSECSLTLPPIISPELLNTHIDNPALVIIDVGNESSYKEGHIPGSVWLPFPSLVSGEPPASGSLPDPEELARRLATYGIRDDSHVVACDDVGGCQAARLLWSLDVLGHPHGSLLDGGTPAWKAAGLPLTQEVKAPRTGQLTAHYQPSVHARFEEVRMGLRQSHRALWDARSPAEFRGEKVLTQRGGHIPGAVNLEWTALLDKEHGNRLKPAEEIRHMLEQRGLTSEKTIITYCQTHRRSALTYWVMRALGYPNVKGYAGAWAEWGNREDAPIEY